MRGLIVLFTVMSLTISLILLMPAQFFTYSGSENQQPEVDLQNVLAWNNTLTVNLTDTTDTTFQLNNYNYRIKVTNHMIHLCTYAVWWIFEWDHDYFHYWKNSVDVSTDAWVQRGTALYLEPSINCSRVDADYLDNDTLTYNCKNGKTETKTNFSFNTTAYDNFTEAIDADDAFVTFLVDWSDRNTGLNAFQLVGMVLTGTLPGIDDNLSIVFGFLSWGFIAAAVYIAFIFALRLAGAIFGGGGA